MSETINVTIVTIKVIRLIDRLQANQQLEDASFEKNDAVAAVQKLQGVIKLVQTEMADAQEAADR